MFSAQLVQTLRQVYVFLLVFWFLNFVVVLETLEFQNLEIFRNFP